MRHNDDEIEKAARRFSDLADDLDPADVPADHLDDLSAVAHAADTVRDDESRLLERVRVARGHGRSWNELAVALGVSRQAARQRFADKIDA